MRSLIITTVFLVSTLLVTLTSSKFIDHGFKYSLGANIPEKRNPNIPVRGAEYLPDVAIPEEFDAREKWPDCPSLMDIRNQEQCGSCVAHSTASAITDRICIHSNGTQQFRVSAEYILSCADKDICFIGTSPEQGWEFYSANGVVSGGPKDSKEGCQPLISVKKEPTICYHHCTNGDYPIALKNDLHFGQSYLAYLDDVETAQREIFTNGPITAGFFVYDDFEPYNFTNVYEQTWGGVRGGHSVKIIGWGVQDDTPYWLATNSWGKDFGIDGNFKIIRGTNECEIEHMMFSMIPKFK